MLEYSCSGCFFHDLLLLRLDDNVDKCSMNFYTFIMSIINTYNIDEYTNEYSWLITFLLYNRNRQLIVIIIILIN